METDKRGHVVVAVLLALLILLALAAAVVGTPAASAQPDESGGGQLTGTDQDLLVKVHQAGLWEIPAGRQAQRNASSQVVRDVGADLVTDHTKLDAQVVAVAGRLGVALPSQPTEEQQAWMAELSGKVGPDYDQTFVNRLRAAHGTVCSVSTQVRAGTRNSVIRTFAQHVNGIAMRHMTMLESTGLVNFDALPEPDLPAAPASSVPPESAVEPVLGPATSVPPNNVAARVAPTDEGGPNPGLVLVICIAEAGLTIGLLRLLRSR